LSLVRRLRLPALFCALSVLLCELISRPYANTGISDEWPYLLMAQKLAAPATFSTTAGGLPC